MDLNRIKKHKSGLGYTALIGSLLILTPLNNTYAEEINEEPNQETIQTELENQLEDVSKKQETIEIVNQTMIKAMKLHNDEQFEEAIKLYQALHDSDLLPADLVINIENFIIRAEAKEFVDSEHISEINVLATENDNLEEEASNTNASIEKVEESELLDERTDNNVIDQTPSLAKTTTNKQSADELYKLAISGPYASQAWEAAKEGRHSYPNDVRFIDALEATASRMLIIGSNSHRSREFKRAIEYYDEILAMTDVSSVIRTEVLKFKNRALTQKNILADDYYQESVTAAYATEAWEAANEGRRLYPGDDRFIDAISQAAQRMLTIGANNHRSGDYSRAIEYYDDILNTTEVSSNVKTLVTLYKSRASNKIILKTADTYYNDAVNSAYASGAWEAAKEGRLLYPNDNRFIGAISQASQRMLTIGASSHRSGNYNRAIEYYDEILNAPEVSSNVKDLTRLYKSRATNKVIVKTADTYYNEATTSTYASEAWEAAKEGRQLYPNDSRFNGAISQAAQRMLTIGSNSHRSGNYSRAKEYYSQILNTSGISKAIRIETQAYRNQADDNKKLVTASAYYNAAMNASFASEAWEAAQEGRHYYPKDNLLINALSQAARRMTAIGTNSHLSGNYKRAIEYYNEVLSNEDVQAILRNDVEVYKTQAQNNQKLMTAGDYYNSSISSPFASDAWKLAGQGYKYFPNNSKTLNAISSASQRMFTVATQTHNRGQFKEAVQFYEELENQSRVSNEIVNRSRANRYLAMNDLHITKSVYSTTNYIQSLNEALTTHTSDNHVERTRNQTQKRNPKTGVMEWVNASTTETAYYLNPFNFLDFTINKNDSKMNALQIATATLNVRSGPSTVNESISSVTRNQIFDILDYRTGWYKIKVNGQDGWVSSAYVSLISQPKSIDLGELFVTINTASLNMRSGPSRLHPILSSVSRGEQFKVRDEQNGWFEIVKNGVIGWVSSDYVDITNGTPKGMLQFLKLSGGTGISVRDIDVELQNKGILHGTGKYFSEAANKFNINEIYLLSHALLETGHGTSRLATGIYVDEVDGKSVPGKTVYNMFGIRAYDESAEKSGSEYAYKQEWDTPGKAILGGAEWISNQYINNSNYKQDTLYKMRWNPNNPTVHQYATDIGWANKQTNSLSMIVELSRKYDLVLRYDIPIYR